MTPVPDRSTFEAMYAGQAPWDIGKPQKPFIDVADRIAGSVLDAGCGTGDMALFFAERGCQVTGIDFIEEAINRARRKAAEQGVQATFLVKDAMTLKDWTERFDIVIDSGLFHVFNDEDRHRYVEGLRPDASVSWHGVEDRTTSWYRNWERSEGIAESGKSFPYPSEANLSDSNWLIYPISAGFRHSGKTDVFRKSLYTKTFAKSGFLPPHTLPLRLPAGRCVLTSWHIGLCLSETSSELPVCGGRIL